MGVDEAGTLRRLSERRQSVLEPLITAHHGRIVNLMGDGLMAEFASVVDWSRKFGRTKTCNTHTSNKKSELSTSETSVPYNRMKLSGSRRSNAELSANCEIVKSANDVTLEPVMSMMSTPSS